MSSNTITLSPIYYPTQISSCVLWLDGADPFANGILPTNGSTIGTWKNKGTSAINIVNSGSPTFSNAIINSNGAVRFPGSAYLQDTGFIHTLSNKTYFLVTQGIDSTNPTTQGIMYFGNNGFVYNTQNGIAYQGPESAYNNQFGFLQAFGNGGYYYSFGSSYANTPLGIYGDTCSNTSASIYVNGSNLSNFTLSYTPQNSTGFRMGRRVDSLGQYYNGYICEVLAFNTLLNTSQRQQTEGYLAWKWGLQTSLPSNHPYKNTPVYTPNTLPPQFRSNLASIPFAQSLSPFSFFRPTSISNCALWLDAADPNGNGSVPSNGSSLSSWVDKSGSGNTASGGVSPTFSNNGVVFNGTSTYLSTNYTANPVNESVLIVATWTGSASRNFCMLGTSITNGRNYNIINSGGVFVKWDVWGVGGYALTSGVVVNVRFLTTGIYNGSGSTSLNGNNQSAAAAFSTSGGGKTNIGTGVLADYYEGTINEIIVYSSALSQSQYQRVEGYLAWKWGLQGNLPSTHPYKNAPPGLPVPSVPPRLLMANRFFQPTSITGCGLWLDAADPATITATGTSISAWADKSGNGRNFTQATSSNQPTYVTNSWNSLPILRFSSSYLSNAGFSLYNSASSGGAVFVTFKTTNINQQSQLMQQMNSGGSNNWTEVAFSVASGPGYSSNNYGSIGFHRGNGSVTQTASNTIAINTNYIYSGTLSNSGTTPTSVGIFLNGTQYTSVDFTAGVETGFFSPGSYPNTNTATISVGARQIIGSYNYLAGDIAELVWYNSQITTAQRQQVEGYLAWKWGLQGNLPSNHPWKKWPPPPS